VIALDLWVDIGNFFSSLVAPIYWAVSWVLVGFHEFFSYFLDRDAGVTWALSIILLTMVIRTILIPLFVKQINSARNMQLLQPKIKALQEKYGADRERLGQETMKLYKDEGVNPMASCWPLLFQMPIFVSLFWVLRDAASTIFIEGTCKLAPENLAVPKGAFETNVDTLCSLTSAKLFGARISATFLPMDDGWSATQTLAIILIVGMVCTLFFTQLQLMRKNMPPEALQGPMAQQQKMMLVIFPVMYAFMGVNIPIGVLLYWLTTNLWTAGQQYVLIRNNPAPNTPAYIDWEERMIAKGKDPEEIIAKRQGKKKKSEQTKYDPNKVARQQTPADTDKPKRQPAKKDPRVVQPPEPAAEGESDAKTVKRRQPPKSSRAKRKKQ
jgi:YidC/Oxa1 family membrane protein insertase